MTLYGVGIARVLHVLGVVIWIGGVAFVTTVVLPAAARLQNAEDRVAMFERIERRFAWIARGATLVVGASGFYMVEELHLWDRFGRLSYWWMDAMAALWTLFTILLFVAEPLFLHDRFAERMRRDPVRAFRLVQRAHWLLLLLSLVTIAGAVAGVHG